MDQNQTTTTGGSPTACIDVAAMLALVNQEIATYEARKLSQLKAELDAFVKKKQSVVDDYTKKQPVLLATWKGQNTQIAQLSANLKCMFPGGQWKTYIGECVCATYKDLASQGDKVKTRQDCALGTLEARRNDARAAFDAAKAYLDTLTTNAAKVDAELAANAKFIQTIQTQLQGTDKAKAIYVFWFQLLPSHVRLAPGGLPADCLTWASDEAPWELCTSIPTPDSKAPHAVPWLIDPGAYGEELNCAWTRYNEAREASAAADAAFAAAPDDLAAAVKALNDAIAGRDDNILACLGAKFSKGPNCDTAPAGSGGGTTPAANGGVTPPVPSGHSPPEPTPIPSGHAQPAASVEPAISTRQAPHVDPPSDQPPPAADVKPGQPPITDASS